MSTTCLIQSQSRRTNASRPKRFHLAAEELAGFDDYLIKRLDELLASPRRQSFAEGKACWEEGKAGIVVSQRVQITALLLLCVAPSVALADPEFNMQLWLKDTAYRETPSGRRVRRNERLFLKAIAEGYISQCWQNRMQVAA